MLVNLIRCRNRINRLLRPWCMPLLSDNSDFKISHTAKCIASHDSDLTTLYRRPSMCGKCHIHLRIFQYFIFFYHRIRAKSDFFPRLKCESYASTEFICQLCQNLCRTDQPCRMSVVSACMHTSVMPGLVSAFHFFFQWKRIYIRPQQNIFPMLFLPLKFCDQTIPTGSMFSYLKARNFM